MEVRYFWCAASREHAPIALLNMGVAALVCNGISQYVKVGETLTLNIERGIVRFEETGEEL